GWAAALRGVPGGRARPPSRGAATSSSLPCSRSSSARCRQGAGLPADVLEEIVPRFDERVSPLSLEAPREHVDIHAGRGETGRDLLCVAAVHREELVDDPVL